VDTAASHCPDQLRANLSYISTCCQLEVQLQATPSVLHVVESQHSRPTYQHLRSAWWSGNNGAGRQMLVAACLHPRGSCLWPSQAVHAMQGKYGRIDQSWKPNVEVSCADTTLISCRMSSMYLSLSPWGQDIPAGEFLSA
jgi:hypothetical protein